MRSVKLLIASELKSANIKSSEAQRVERHPRRPCFTACTRSRGENLRTATANGRRGRAVIGRYYKRGRRGAREQSVARQTESRVVVQVRDRASERAATQVSRGASATRQPPPRDATILACMPPSEENRVKRGGWRAAMTGAGA